MLPAGSQARRPPCTLPQWLALFTRFLTSGRCPHSLNESCLRQLSLRTLCGTTVHACTARCPTHTQEGSAPPPLLLVGQGATTAVYFTGATRRVATSCVRVWCAGTCARAEQARAGEKPKTQKDLKMYLHLVVDRPKNKNYERKNVGLSTPSVRAQKQFLSSLVYFNTDKQEKTLLAVQSSPL